MLEYSGSFEKAQISSRMYLYATYRKKYVLNIFPVALIIFMLSTPQGTLNFNILPCSATSLLFIRNYFPIIVIHGICHSDQTPLTQLPCDKNHYPFAIEQCSCNLPKYNNNTTQRELEKINLFTGIGREARAQHHIGLISKVSLDFTYKTHLEYYELHEHDTPLTQPLQNIGALPHTRSSDLR